MSSAGRVARQAAGNATRGVRRLLQRFAFPRAGSCWVELVVRENISELLVQHLPFQRDVPLHFLQMLEVLDAAAEDERVDGVLLTLQGGPPSLGMALALRRAVLRARDRGTPVVAYAETLDAPGLLLASAATRFWIPEVGSVFVVGIRLEGTYLRGLLDHLGVEPEVVRTGSHKSAGDRFTSERMSDAEREQLDALADDLYETLVDAIATGRGLEPDAVRRIIDSGPHRGRAAVEAGLVDGCLYPDEIDEQLAALSPERDAAKARSRRSAAGSDEKDGLAPDVRRIEAEAYYPLRRSCVEWQPLFREVPRIAYVVACGSIGRGRRSQGIGSDDLRGLLERLRKAEEVRAIVLRIDSPGGDSLASDLLWRSVSQVAKDKPVVVSMGDVTASGGYYMAVAANALLAEATTITGSIGVVGGKANLGALYRRLGVGKDAVERGARAGLLSETRGFSDDERRAVQAELDAVYETFVDRVMSGRGLSLEELSRVGEGRVWSGARALSLGLVDAIGGPLEALREARERAGFASGERAGIDVYPRGPRVPSARSLLRRLAW